MEKLPDRVVDQHPPCQHLLTVVSAYVVIVQATAYVEARI